jgi:tetratricopeptide (TPR) repeat protein
VSIYIEGIKIKNDYVNEEIHMQTTISTLFQKGIHFANQHAYDAAVKCFETILKHDPDRIDAIINSGLMHYYAGRFDIAEKYIHLSLNKRPNSIMIFENHDQEVNYRVEQFDRLHLNQRTIGATLADIPK